MSSRRCQQIWRLQLEIHKKRVDTDSIVAINVHSVDADPWTPLMQTWLMWTWLLQTWSLESIRTWVSPTSEIRVYAVRWGCGGFGVTSVIDQFCLGTWIQELDVLTKTFVHKNLCFVCILRVFCAPDIFPWLFGHPRWSQQNALICRHSNCFPPKNWMNPFRYVLGTRRWLVFAIYCLLEGQEA